MKRLECLSPGTSQSTVTLLGEQQARTAERPIARFMPDVPRRITLNKDGRQLEDRMPIYRLFPFCIFVKSNLKPLHNALISGYMFFWSSNACGTTLTAQC